MTARREDENVITLLERQHVEIRTLLGVVAGSTGDKRRESFQDLVRLLVVHETAEEEVLHPEVRKLDGGEAEADLRLAEERHARELLSALYDLGTDAEGFDDQFEEFKACVLAHAGHEEREEFPLLRAAHGQEKLRAMADAVRAAEQIPPPRPHPGVETAAADLMAGPPLAIMDHAREAIRSVLRP
ncbi:MAG: hemerythrin domain-containing protein [Kibdelosporangium sp.]